jgi:hypothetical protein
MRIAITIQSIQSQGSVEQAMQRCEYPHLGQLVLAVGSCKLDQIDRSRIAYIRPLNRLSDAEV